MVIVRLKGGLGNQMFQYALGRKLALANNDSLRIELSWFGQSGNDTSRQYALENYNISGKVISTPEAAKYRPGFLHASLNRLKGYFTPNHHYQFNPELFKRQGDIYLDGFFQSYKYFTNLDEVLRHDFTPKAGLSAEAKAIEEQIAIAKVSVGLHIRRGDYVTNPNTNEHHGVCPLEYYLTALNELSTRLGEFKLFIFSDDIEWAKSYLKYEVEMVFVSKPELKDYEELYLMSKCQHQIIANSSFSWWAAWLNQNENKTVIAPKVWLQSAVIDMHDLLPPKWMAI